MDDLIPIVLFLVIGGVIALIAYLRYRGRKELLDTVRVALSQGESLTPELIDRLAMSLTNPDADLRRGVIALALGVAVLIFAFAVGEPDAIGPLTGIAMFPITLGIAYLGLWALVGRKRPS